MEELLEAVILGGANDEDIEFVILENGLVNSPLSKNFAEQLQQY